jgi:ribosomal protein S18 acetylase RimI-like enzyme
MNRVAAFIRRYDERLVEEIVPTKNGRVLLTPSLPLVHYLNKLSLDPETHATVEELTDEIEAVFAEAGLAHRKVVCEGEVGASLAPAFQARGWKREELLVMLHRGPMPPVDTAGVDEVEPAEVEPVWAEGMRASPEIRGEEEVRQLVAAQHRRRIAVDVRYFAARVDGEIASYCELFSDGQTGQIESVMTLERFRRRGLAKAVVTRALAESRSIGHELTFLEADADDWPKELYRRLGFEAVGRTWGFLHPPPSD